MKEDQPDQTVIKNKKYKRKKKKKKLKSCINEILQMQPHNCKKEIFFLIFLCLP